MNHVPPSSDQARDLLDRARSVGQANHDAAWPWVTFLVGLGVANSMGFLALGAATMDGVPRAAYHLAIGGMVLWIAPLLAFGMVFARGARRGFGKRWRGYIAAWGLTYSATLLVGLGFFEGALWFWIPAAVVIGAVCLTCAALEARR